MISLCMDTSHVLLAIALLKDGKVLASCQEPCWKRQSEELFVKLTALMDEAGLAPQDIGEVVVSEGPGSYTGVRIAMTVAKVFCAMGNVPLYTVGTLQLYGAGLTGRVILDARGKRAYTCLFEKGNAVGVPEAKPLDEICTSTDIVGDGHLVGKEDKWPDIANNFSLLREKWKKAANVHQVVPEYLKSAQAYMVKK